MPQAKNGTKDKRPPALADDQRQTTRPASQAEAESTTDEVDVLMAAQARAERLLARAQQVAAEVLHTAESKAESILSTAQIAADSALQTAADKASEVLSAAELRAKQLLSIDPGNLELPEAERLIRAEAAADTLRESQRIAADVLREVNLSAAGVLMTAHRAAADVLLSAQREAAALLLEARMSVMDSRPTGRNG